MTKLTDFKISYCQRVKENVVKIKNKAGVFVSAQELFKDLAPNEFIHLKNQEIYKTNPFKTDLSAVKSADGQSIFLLSHSADIKNPILAYSSRWSIENGFKLLKSGGFNMEETKITDCNRLYNLYRILVIVTAIFFKLGIIADSVQPIKIKNHDRKEQSFLQYGLQKVKDIGKKIMSESNIIISKLFREFIDTLMQKMCNST